MTKNQISFKRPQKKTFTLIEIAIVISGGNGGGAPTGNAAGCAGGTLIT